MRKIVDDAFVIFGMMFLICIVLSYFVPVGNVLYNGRAYLLVLFLAIIVGRYARFRIKSKSN
ncbi:hypothetical protein HB825_01195 [Listeria booriae]|uniref:Uncharacterized protein n=1 Tax=Listeria booriae TaxID=1552123 RepID=A0A7X0XD70_9LIST|nr:hypothetical protein [Listeria booriae]MBC1491546.1 hypothetical protein [Listeria booriae]MBC1502363.1 hypothetical protein [Listeria booriae]MBC1523431.1 hypothetical protein [Listeria booriae]MBC1529790.1 hypothetical protein [Listeria booriae]MBC1797592.1 hypothetical protein [Listeria booriae]